MQKKRHYDSHSVYNRVFDYIKFNESTILLRRQLINEESFFGKIKYLRRILIIYLDLRVLIRCRYMKGNNRIFVSEFSTHNWLLFSIFLRQKYRKRIILNINHNLSKGNFSKYLLKILSNRIEVAMLIGSSEVLKEFSNLQIYDLKKNVTPFGDIKKIIFFWGRRKEQVNISERCINLVCQRISPKLLIKHVGKDTNQNLTEEEYSKLFDAETLVVLLYGDKNYSNRHSGIVIEAIVRGTRVLAPSNAVNQFATKKYKHCTCYKSEDELLNKIDQIILEKSKMFN